MLASPSPPESVWLVLGCLHFLAEEHSHRRQHEQAVRNMDWLGGHWGELLPQALDKFIAIAGQQAFIAATPE